MFLGLQAMLPRNSTLRRTLLPAFLLSATHISEAMSMPTEWFLPRLTWMETVSIRQPKRDEDGVQYLQGGRLDFLVRERNLDDQPLRSTYRWYGETLDSTIVASEWSNALPLELKMASQRVQLEYRGGLIAQTDTIRWIWYDSLSCALGVSTNGSWRDSTCYDSRYRLIFESERGGPPSDTTATNSYHEIYRAWFRNPSDSLPQIASMRGILGNSQVLDDSVFAVGDPNGPDSLRGKRNSVLVRDGSGRIIKASPTVYGDSTFYSYDEAGRLDRLIEFSSGKIDTTAYLYSWSDPVGVRRQTKSSPGIRLIAEGIQIDLSVPGRIQAELISFDGKRLAVLADRNLPAGRSFLPISAKPGELVHIESENHTTVLVVPVHGMASP
jgi:hypothetical protein